MPEERWVTLKDGRRVKIGGTKGGVVAIAAAAAVIAGGGGAAGLGGALSGGSGSAVTSEALAGNSGGAVDSLPGRSLNTRRAEGRESAKRGRSDEAWSRVKFKQLKRKVEREMNCIAAATDQVREFLTKTPCTSMRGVVLAVGDGHGNAAVVTVVRVGFKTKAHAREFKEVEDVHGSGDIRPLGITAALGLADVKMTGLHYHARPDGTAMIVAEADTATGHVDGGTLDALADIASYLPTT